jgi:peroxiredoxin
MSPDPVILHPMNRLSYLTPFFLLLLSPLVQADLVDAQLIEKSYLTAVDKWSLEMRVASTPEEHAKALATRPDVATYERKIWHQIGNSLAAEWTIQPAAWFLNNAQGLITTGPDGSTGPTFSKESEAIRNALETYHLNSSKIAPLCMALVGVQDPRVLSTLEKIQTQNTDKKVQGVAALGAAMILRSIGDNPEIMRKRLTYLRKAIIQSNDVEVNGSSVQKLTENEFYIIQNLTKGRVAPDLTGVDCANKPLSLSANKGKIIVLLFWGINDPDANRVVQITSAMITKFKGRSFVVIGVNHDSIEKLRALQADGTVTWQNFSDPENKLSGEYRVGSWPLVYVLDEERKIQYAGTPGSFVELTAAALLEKIDPTTKR